MSVGVLVQVSKKVKESTYVACRNIVIWVWDKTANNLITETLNSHATVTLLCPDVSLLFGVVPQT